MIHLDEDLIDRVHRYFLTEMMRVPDRSAEVSMRAAAMNSAADAEKVIGIERPRIEMTAPA